MSKDATLLLIVILTVSSLIMAKPANAQSIPTPSVPEFTVKYTNHPYYVPSINYTNPYTGEAMTYGGFYVDSKSIEVTIKNQKFDYPSYHLFYNVRLKFHFTEKWDERFPIVQYLNSSGNGTAQYIAEFAPRQSNAEFTVISYYLSSGQFANAQLDFQVEALVGYDSALGGVEGHTQSAIAYYATSNWSNTQTITIGGIPPSITLLSPENKTYNIMDIPLSFAVDNPTSWIGYSLDN